MSLAFRDAIYRVVYQVPAGRVATYGQVAELAGYPGAARACGTALRDATRQPELPWHRVINASGKVSPGGGGVGRPLVQRRLLEEEGVHFRASGRCDLKRYRWKGQVIGLDES